MHMVSKINRFVALAVLHAHVSTQLCCDRVSRVVSDWIVESKLLKSDCKLFEPKKKIITTHAS